MPICFLYPAFVEKHTERQKGIKPQGMTIVTVVPQPWPQPQLQLSASLCPGKWVKHKRCSGLVDTTHTTDGAAVLLIDILLGYGAGLGRWLLTVICCCSLLLLLGHKEAQCRAEEAEWNSQAAGSHRLSQTARQPQLTFPPSNGLRSPGRPRVRSDRPRHTERQRGREEWRYWDIIPFPITLLFLSSISFCLLCWENSDYKNIIWLSLHPYMFLACYYSFTTLWLCPGMLQTYSE